MEPSSKGQVASRDERAHSAVRRGIHRPSCVVVLVEPLICETIRVRVGTGIRRVGGLQVIDLLDEHKGWEHGRR